MGRALIETSVASAAMIVEKVLSVLTTKEITHVIIFVKVVLKELITEHVSTLTNVALAFIFVLEEAHASIGSVPLIVNAFLATMTHYQVMRVNTA